MHPPQSLAAAAVALLLAGCEQAVVPSSPPHEAGLGGIWTVVRAGEVSSVGALEPRVEFLEEGRRIRLVIPECWEAMTDVAIEGRSIRVGEFVPDRLLPCGDDLREFAGLVHDGLAQAAAIEGAPGRLRITGRGPDVLLVRNDLEPTPQEQQVLDTLHGSAWRYVDGDAPAGPGLPPVRFEPGTVTADGPCGFTGEWRFQGEDLVRFGSMTWEGDGAECDDRSESARSSLADVLDGMERLALDPVTRTLTFTGREGRLVFEAAEP